MASSHSQSGAAATPSGFLHPVFDSQRVFRIVLEAMSRPGRVMTLQPRVAAPPPLLATAAEFLLALADFETTVWLDSQLSRSADVASYIRFHTGAKITADPTQATFAVISDTSAMLPFSAFAQGSPDYPDRTTTLILQAQELTNAGAAFEGPGINGRIAFSAAPVPPNLAHRLAENRTTYPCGLDIVFVTASAIAALPRSARLVRE